MDLPIDFKELLEEFARSKVEVVLVGGYAVAFHGRPRATKDLDLLLEGSMENLSRAADALRRFGAPPAVAHAVGSMNETEVVFLGQPPLRIDLLRSIDGVSTADVLARAVAAVISGVGVQIISLDDLIANKRAAGRPQDLADAQLLELSRASRP